MKFKDSLLCLLGAGVELCENGRGREEPWVWTYTTQQAAAGGSCKRAEVTGTRQEASMKAPQEAPTSGKPTDSG